MPLKNYTTRVPVEQTMGQIQGLLARMGARRISIEYGSVREPSAVEFSIATPHGERHFALPARIDAIHELLKAEHAKRRIDLRYASRQHAAAVGWRLVKDWLEAQLAFLEAEMHSFDEVMLPWLLVDGRHTAYELFESRGLALPPGRGEAGGR